MNNHMIDGHLTHNISHFKSGNKIKYGLHIIRPQLETIAILFKLAKVG